MHFFTPIMWSSLLSVSLLIHCTIARPQGQEDTLAPFNPENLLGESSGTQLIASGDTSSGGNPGRQQTWVEDPESALLASADCNGAILDQTIHPRRSRRSPEIKDSCDLQRPPQQLEEGAEKPVQLNPSSNTPNQPKKNQGPSQSGVDRAVAEQMFRIVFGAPGVNGEQNPDICNIPGSPMLRVPICAPPIWMTSPAILVMPARFWQLSDDCHKEKAESLWCCVTARRPFSELIDPSAPLPITMQSYPVIGFTCRMRDAITGPF